jgi:hypothetical protein
MSMAITLPLPVRVAAGLVAAGLERIRHLPQDLPALSVTVAGQAVRASMRVQQEIADLAGRGDELLSGITNRPTEHPAWAHFDEDDPEPDQQPSTSAATAVPTPASQNPASPQNPASSRNRASQNPASPQNPASSKSSASSKSRKPTSDGSARPSAGRQQRRTTTRHGARVTRPGTSADTTAASDGTPAPSEAGSGPAALPGYDSMTLAQVRARLGDLSPAAVTELLDRERTGAARAPYLTLLTNRLTTLQAGDGQDPLR